MISPGFMFSKPALVLKDHVSMVAQVILIRPERLLARAEDRAVRERQHVRNFTGFLFSGLSNRSRTMKKSTGACNREEH